MNTLFFLGGMGAGALLAVILLIILVCIFVKPNKKAEAWNAETQRLMAERNEIDRAKATHLQGIDASLRTK